MSMFKLPENYFTTPTPPPEGVVSVFGMPGQTAIQKGAIDAAKQQATTMSVGPIAAPTTVSTDGASVTVLDGDTAVDIAVEAVDDADPQLTSFNPAEADDDLRVSKATATVAMQPAVTATTMATTTPNALAIDHEARSLALRAVNVLDATTARVAVAEAAVAQLQGLAAKVAGLESAMEKTMTEAQQSFLAAAADVKQQLLGVDAALASKGLPTLSSYRQPELKLIQVRPVNTPAQVLKDGTVALYYNARGGQNASGVSDQQEFTLTRGAPPRHVPVGYAVVVPSGYVCDVVVESDVVASVSGAGVVEYVLPLAAKATQRTINGGSEICRLVLRKVEACKLVIEKAKGMW